MTHKFARVKHLRKHYTQLKTSCQINDVRDTGPDTENTDHGLDMGVLRTACQPIRIENFEKPYNKIASSNYRIFLIKCQVTSLSNCKCQVVVSLYDFLSFTLFSTPIYESGGGMQMTAEMVRLG